MKTLRLTSVLWALALGACSDTGRPAPKVASVATVATVEVASSKPSPPRVPSERGPLEMHPVVKVATLSDITMSDSHLELRVGNYPGGGAPGAYWFVPMVEGRPDLTQQTRLIRLPATEGGSVQIYGRRPNLVLHVPAGFREPTKDYYLAVTPRGGNKGAFPAVDDGRVGQGIFQWSEGRRLEWRTFEEFGVPPGVPSFRVVGGDDSSPPTIPPPILTKLVADGFSTQDVWVSASTGVVMLIGAARHTGMLNTLVWEDNLAGPELREHAYEFSDVESRVELVGGTSREDVIIRVDDDFLRIGALGWERVGGADDATPPNMWFGAPFVVEMQSGWFARLAQDAPWRPIVVPDADGSYFFEVDPEGVIWTRDGEVLLASRPPKTPYHVISLPDLVASRELFGLKTPPE